MRLFPSICSNKFKGLAQDDCVTAISTVLYCLFLAMWGFQYLGGQGRDVGANKPNFALGNRRRCCFSWNTGSLDMDKKSNTKNEHPEALYSDNGDNRAFCGPAIYTPSMEPHTYWTHIFNSVKANNRLYFNRRQHSYFRALLLWMVLSLRFIHGSAYSSPKGT